jgi:transposase-like protein
MELESRLAKLKSQVEKERSRAGFSRKGFSASCRRNTVGLVAEIGVKRVMDSVGLSSPTIQSWKKQLEETESNEPALTVTRLSLDPSAEPLEREAIARFWIGNMPVEILSRQVLLDFLRSAGERAWLPFLPTRSWLWCIPLFRSRVELMKCVAAVV